MSQTLLNKSGPLLGGHSKGDGGTKTITREETRRFPFALEAEATARHRFETESFVAKSGDDEINNALKGLKEGDEPAKINLLIHESHPAMSAWYGMGWVRAAL